MNFIGKMKTISMADLRTHSRRIVRELKSGERMILSHRGKALAELVPTGFAAKRISPLAALKQAQELMARNPGDTASAVGYLWALRDDQAKWSGRPSRGSNLTPIA